MNEHLLHLVLVTAQRNCEVRVIPESAGPHGVLGGAFRLMRYTDHPPVVYVENLTASVFLESSGDLDSYSAILANIALDGGQSREWLAQLASEYEKARTGQDDLGTTN